MSRFQYHQPESLDEALALLAEVPSARLVAGGTDLMVELRKRREARPPALVSLRRIPALAEIELSGSGRLRIGAALCLSDVTVHAEVRAHYPALVQAMHVFGCQQIQNAATLGGNLCNASPCADGAPSLLAYGAQVELVGPAGLRCLPLDQFLLGPGRTALQTGEVMTAILLDRPSSSSRSLYLRKGRVRMDLAMVNLALLLDVEGETCRRARLVAGAVAPVALRLSGAEAVLEGSGLEPDVLTKAAAIARAEISPISDVRSSAAYRRALVGVLVERGLRRLRDGALEEAGA